MRKLAILFAVLLALLPVAGAHAEGILPVLQTPPPEITETISYHRAMNFDSTPSASTTSDGRYYYKYSSVTYLNYLSFGRALAQEGFSLTDSGFTESGVAHATVTNGAELTLDYNAFYQELTVTYPPRVLAQEVNADDPYVIDEAQASLLPELPHAISYHRMMNASRTPTAESIGEGRYRYEYTDVDHARYLKFGRALAQEGFALTDSAVTEDGAMEARVSNGDAELALTYNPFYHSLRVIYPLGTLAEEANGESRYTVDASQESLLPAMAQTISMHAVTGLTFTSPDRVEGGYRYDYYGVPYECYALFSVKLGEAGFSLVSSEKTEEGLDRAVVSDGAVTLILDYDQDNKYAYVTYPVDVSPRDAALFDDFTAIRTGDTVPLMEDLNATVTGWEPVDLYVTYYYDNNWIPFAKYFDNEYYSGDGIQRMLVYVRIEYNRPDSMSVHSLLRNLIVYCDGQSLSCNYGELTSTAKFSTDGDDTIRTKDVITLAIGFALTEEQAAHPENVAVTFTDKNSAVPYVYFLN